MFFTDYSFQLQHFPKITLFYSHHYTYDSLIDLYASLFQVAIDIQSNNVFCCSYCINVSDVTIHTIKMVNESYYHLSLNSLITHMTVCHDFNI